MLVYCYGPLGLSYDAALPALADAVDEIQVRRILFRGVPGQPADQPGEFSAGLNLSTVTIGRPTGQDGRAAIPIRCSAEDSSLISMVGEVTLGRLRPALCHLSMSSSISGTLANNLMFDRGLQMSVELAVEEFLNKLARSVIERAGSSTPGPVAR